MSVDIAFWSIGLPMFLGALALADAFIRRYTR